MRNLIILFAAAASLTACGGGSSSPDAQPPSGNTNPIAALEAAGKLPKLDRSSDLKGPDANANGVRDDIEAILNKQYTAAAQNAAAMQVARSLQAVFDLPQGDRVAAKRVILLGSRAIMCVSAKFDRSAHATNPSVVTKQIEAMTFNTKARMKAYMNYMSALDGSVWSLPEGDTCEN